MEGATKRARLRDIAYARSGDKGSSSNIGLIAYTPEGYRYLRDSLTSDVVQSYFRALGPVHVDRYEIPGLLAFNFLLKGVLGEGGSRSLRVDAQGKALGVALLEMELEMPVQLHDRCVRKREL
ncbi:MAG: hypothetical protein EHM23_17620 [Acidobacteria bacterium]|nr:MAG: hypothetical protein EHM23_17620 [Acidobacteriota bacterium]